jgi:hypothetical protein
MYHLHSLWLLNHGNISIENLNGLRVAVVGLGLFDMGIVLAAVGLELLNENALGDAVAVVLGLFDMGAVLVANRTGADFYPLP